MPLRATNARACVSGRALLFKRCLHRKMWSGRHHRESCVNSSHTLQWRVRLSFQPQKGGFPRDRGLGSSPDTQLRPRIPWVVGSSPSHCLPAMTVPRGKDARFPDHVYQGLAPAPSVCRTPGCLFSEPQQRGGGVGIRLHYLWLCHRGSGAGPTCQMGRTGTTLKGSGEGFIKGYDTCRVLSIRPAPGGGGGG